MDIAYLRPWHGASSILLLSRTGSAASFWLDSCRSRVRQSSVSRPWRRRWHAMAGQRFSIPTRAVNSSRWTSFKSQRTRRSRSPWTAKEPGGTPFLGSASGARSSMKRSTCTSTPTCRRRAPRLGTTWPSTTARGHIRRLACRRSIRRTSARCSQSRQRLNPHGNPLGDGSNPVQTIRATSSCCGSHQSILRPVAP